MSLELDYEKLDALRVAMLARMFERGYQFRERERGRERIRVFGGVQERGEIW